MMLHQIFQKRLIRDRDDIIKVFDRAFQPPLTTATTTAHELQHLTDMRWKIAALDHMIEICKRHQSEAVTYLHREMARYMAGTRKELRAKSPVYWSTIAEILSDQTNDG